MGKWQKRVPGCKFDQNTLYKCMKSHSESDYYMQSIYANKTKLFSTVGPIS